MSAEPVQEFFSIGEVCELTGLKPHVLRYWESQFKFLNPAKNRSGNRVYQRKEVELVVLVKHLLYVEKYTIDGARQKVDEHRKKGQLKPNARRALDVHTLASIEQELVEVMQQRPEVSIQALNAIIISRNLERSADHATNIAEDVIFWLRGSDVRHNMLLAEAD